MTNNICDVCNRESTSIETVASGIAPVSYGSCAECTRVDAEGIGILEFWIASFGGPEKAPEFSVKLGSYFDGAYRGWEEICERYTSNEENIVASMRKEFGLDDHIDQGIE